MKEQLTDISRSKGLHFPDTPHSNHMSLLRHDAGYKGKVIAYTDKIDTS